jgi:FMN phosphatase YigB (HAD superfamily)
MLQTIDSDNVVCFDVDDTLVIWKVPPGMEEQCREFTNYGVTERLLPHEKHIKLLKEFKFRGHTVIVWSQGGFEWAREVVRMLELEPYVDFCMSKPKWMVDDLPPSAWVDVFYRNITDVTDVKFEDLEK